MPQFVTVHRAPGLKAEDLAQNASEVLRAKVATFRQIYANLASGFLVSIFEAENLEQLEEQMEALGYPIDETHEIQFSASRGEMEQMVSHGSR